MAVETKPLELRNGGRVLAFGEGVLQLSDMMRWFRTAGGFHLIANQCMWTREDGSVCCRPGGHEGLHEADDQLSETVSEPPATQHSSNTLRRYRTRGGTDFLKCPYAREDGQVCGKCVDHDGPHEVKRIPDPISPTTPLVVGDVVRTKCDRGPSMTVTTLVVVGGEVRDAHTCWWSAKQRLCSGVFPLATLKRLS